jgi:DNA mismatch repair protein MutL
VVELRDIFHATPARLKFLRTDRAEAQAIADTVRRLALAAPAVAFSLSDEDREVFRAPAGSAADRIAAVLGSDFVENAVPLDGAAVGFRLTGWAALPTYSRGAAVAQHLCVNGRPVRDKLLLGALRDAYSDLLARDRHPAAALFLTCAPELVDLNVHPAKAEVRFRDPGLVRGLVVGALRQTLAGAGHRGASTTGGAMLGAFRAALPLPPAVERALWSPARPAAQGFAEPAGDGWAAARVETPAPEVDAADFPLGVARAQVH